jgi:hypothetical protein
MRFPPENPGETRGRLLLMTMAVIVPFVSVETQGNSGRIVSWN